MFDFEVKIDSSKQREFWKQLPIEAPYRITWMNKAGLYQFRSVDDNTFQKVKEIVFSLEGEVLNIQSSVLEVLFPE